VYHRLLAACFCRNSAEFLRSTSNGPFPTNLLSARVGLFHSPDRIATHCLPAAHRAAAEVNRAQVASAARVRPPEPEAKNR